MAGENKLLRLVLLPLIIALLYAMHNLKLVVFLILRLAWKRPVATVVRTPEERFNNAAKLGYTFQSRYVDLPIGGGKTLPRMHYVDEGPRDAAETVLCLHGEPSWSFLYRHVINVLTKAGFRVIAPDFIGFGKSDKYTHPEAYTFDLHAMSLRLLLDHLKVKNLTLVCQDWGGLTGLSVVKDCPDKFSRLVIMNTGLPDGSDFTLYKVWKLTPFMVWRAVVDFLGKSLPVKMVFRLAMSGVSKEVLEMYDAPFPTSNYRGGAAKWPLMVPLSSSDLVSGDMRRTKEFLRNSWRSPALIMFSDDDPITGAMTRSFEEMLPHAKKHTIHGGGHFLQETRGEELAEQVIHFINASK